MPYLFHQLLNFGHVCPVQAAGLVHALDDLIDIIAYALELGGVLLYVGIVNIDNVAVQRHFAQVGALVFRTEQLHLLLYQGQFVLRDEKFNLNFSYPFGHWRVLLSLRFYRGLGYPQQAIFHGGPVGPGGENTEVCTHFLCLLGNSSPYNYLVGNVRFGKHTQNFYWIFGKQKTAVNA